MVYVFIVNLPCREIDAAVADISQPPFIGEPNGSKRRLPSRTTAVPLRRLWERPYPPLPARHAPLSLQPVQKVATSHVRAREAKDDVCNLWRQQPLHPRTFKGYMPAVSRQQRLRASGGNVSMLLLLETHCVSARPQSFAMHLLRWRLAL